ncbi:hypothetical protein BJX70DRAFT_363216 [Aspergillus crustosus]
MPKRSNNAAPPYRRKVFPISLWPCKLQLAASIILPAPAARNPSCTRRKPEPCLGIRSLPQNKSLSCSLLWLSLLSFIQHR